MKVLLLKNIPTLGKVGEIKEVKDGYGHNFLIAKGLAELATNETIKKYEHRIKKLEEIKSLEIAEAMQMKNALNEINLVIEKKTGANNNLFGSLTKEELSVELNKQKRINIDKKLFSLPPIKTVGKFIVNVHLGNGINAELKVEIVAI